MKHRKWLDNMETNATEAIAPDPAKDGKKCGHPGSMNRVFDLRNSAATQEACKQECVADNTCVAFSGIWQEWCIGCKTPLDVYHSKIAVAYVKEDEAIAPDPAKDGKKCGHPGSMSRVFDLRNSAATQEACKQECVADTTCVAFSGIWQEWCIGCKSPLDVYHEKLAVAYVKATTTTTTTTTATTTTTTALPSEQECPGLVGTSCHDIVGWHDTIELEAQDVDMICVAMLATTGGNTCATWCENAGYDCIRAQDDKDSVCTLDQNHTRQTTIDNGCQQSWHNQMCQCGRMKAE